MRPHLLVAALLALAAGTTQASHILPAFSVDGTDCDATIQPFTPFNAYIVAVLGGDAAAGGVQGAEFRVEGFDPAWFANPIPDPFVSVFVGNPIAEGVSLGYSTCRPGPVLLYTISVIVLAPMSPRTLRVTQHSAPSSPNFQCPLVVLCTPPFFTRICVPGGSATINQPFCLCCVAAEPTSWSRVKSLYAN